MATIGSLFMGLGLVSALVAIGALFWGRSLGEKDGESVTNTGYLATFGALGAMTVSVLIMVSAFFREDFSLMYVVQNHSTDVSGLSWLYKLSGIWAGREGSLLFWAWLIAIFAGYLAYRRIEKTDGLSNMSIAVMNIVLALFIVALFAETNNPFKLSPVGWVGPDGTLLIAAAMNPLLQHWAMILHPPTLFIGYAGMTVPFAFAMGALIVGDASSAWIKIVDRITVFSWVMLGIGIGLGAIWAYVVLGWGGYWAWDPVENASLLPWLTGVGLLHSFTVYKRRNGFKSWAIMMAAISFSVVILGTFITRSGLVQSVHAFGEDPFSAILFGAMIILPLVLAGWGLYVRKDTFTGADEFESLTSKESSYYFNNVLMLVATIVVSYLTVSSALPSWLPGGGQSFGPDTYDAIAHPVGILYVAIMAVCPLLSWRITEGPVFWRRAKWPMVGAGALGAVLVGIWYTQLRPIADKVGSSNSFEPLMLQSIYAIVGLLVAALAIAVSVFMFVEGARRRAAAKGESFGSSLMSIIFRARTQSGGYITHLGIGIVLIGLIGSSMFVDDMDFAIPQQAGAQFEAGGYTFNFKGFNEETVPNGDIETVLGFDVMDGSRLVQTVTPGQIAYYQQQQTRLNVDVIVEPLRDVFVVYNGIDSAGNIQMNVKVNPLISFAWVGFALLTLGATLASWPKKQPVPLPTAGRGARAPGKKR